MEGRMAFMTDTARPERFRVLGLVTRSNLTASELETIPPRARGAWIEVHTLAAWSPRGAVTKVRNLGFIRDPRMVKFRAERIGD